MVSDYKVFPNEADVSSFKAKAEAVEIQAAEIADDLTIKLEKKMDQ